MIQQAKCFQERIASGQPLLLAEYAPPRGADPALVRSAAKRLAGKVHALGVSDNRDRVAMAALAAASVVASEGVEPILHVTTRDRNRIALVSEALGAQALGIQNLLCTSGTHQTLGHFRAAKNVYDLDAVQLLQTCADLPQAGKILGEPETLASAGGLCLGGVASPDADPLELQVMRLVKKVQAGAQFLITQPVFDLERFGLWWKEISKHGLPKKVAILAGIQPLCGSVLAEVGKKRPAPRIPQAMLAKVQAAKDPAAQRTVALEIARETIAQLPKLCPGLRGFCISAEDEFDAAVQLIETSGLGSN